MPDSVEDLIRKEADRLGVPSELALAVAEQESGFNPTLINPKKVKTKFGEEQAVGTFQFLPSTAKARGIDPNDARQNIAGGVGYLRELMDRHDGDLEAVLREYGGVKTDTTYVPGVLARIPKFKGIATPQADILSATAPPSAATAGMLQPSTSDDLAAPKPSPIMDAAGRAASSVGNFGKNALNAAVVAPVKGVLELAKTGLKEGPVAAGTQAVQGIVAPVVEHLKGATKAREAGDPLTWAKEMVQAIPLFGPILGDVGEQLKEGDISGAAGTAVGSLLPIRGVPKSKTLAAGAEASAAASMTKLLRAAGDGSPAAERALQKVLPLALDRSLLRATKGRYVRAVQEAKSGLGKKVGTAVAGPLGDEIVKIDPVINGLNDLKDTVTNYVPVNQTGQPIGAGATGATALKGVAFNARLIDQINTAQEILSAHGPTVRLRQLVHLRQDWDKYVYASKSWLNKEDMVKQYEASAKSAANDAIRGIIDQDPRLINLADLDKAYHLHSQLYSFISDNAFGRGQGLHYFPGWGLTNLVTRRMLDMAVKAPTWRLMSISARARLADAMAAGNQSAIRQVLRPVIGGSVAAVGRGDDDLVTNQQDEALIERTPTP